MPFLQRLEFHLPLLPHLFSLRPLIGREEIRPLEPVLRLRGQLRPVLRHGHREQGRLNEHASTFTSHQSVDVSREEDTTTVASTTFRNHGTPPPLSHFAYRMAWETDGGEADESAYFSHSLLLTALELFQGGERCRF